VDFGGEQVEVDAIVGEKIAVPLAYGNGTQQRSGPLGIGVWRRIEHGNCCAYPCFARLLADFVARIVPSWGDPVAPSWTHHPIKTARAKGGNRGNCPKRRHGDKLAPVTRVLSLCFAGIA
jgi:hypothetical protein